jgi:predicted aldo/keto reductase-like oxidoreductase
MQYRKFGPLDWQVSVLGFGCARFPTLSGKQFAPDIDEPEAIRMLRYAIDHGVNYIDTAYPYHQGNSEPLVGRALQDGYRERVRLATKCPIWLLERGEDFDRYLDEQLGRLRTDYVDFYLMHGLDAKQWARMRELNLFPCAERAIADGRIGHLGFSFHDSHDVFRQIVDGYDGWAFCQVIYNFLDTEMEAGERGVKYAAGKGLAVVVMEPIQEGRIARPRGAVAKVWKSITHRRTPAALALQWVWDQPEVAVALSGMSKMRQVQENVASADASCSDPLTAEERDLIAQVQAAWPGSKRQTK